jgi:hypothetical protein
MTTQQTQPPAFAPWLKQLDRQVERWFQGTAVDKAGV